MKKAVKYTAIAVAALAAAGAAVVAADTIDGRPLPPRAKVTAPKQGPKAALPPPVQKRFGYAVASSGARLGVQIMDLSEELRTHFGAPLDQGVLVARVEKDSPAEKAGILVGDVIVEVDSEPVAESMDVIGALAGHKAGDEVPVIAVRGGKRVTLTAKVDQATDQTWSGAQGMLPHGKGMRMWSMDFESEAVDKLEQRVEALEKRLEKLEKTR